MKLKWYCGTVHCALPGKREVKQRHVIVCTTSQKRLIELLTPFDRVTAYQVAGWFSCVKSPPTNMLHKPVEEAVWLEPAHCKPYIKLA